MEVERSDGNGDDWPTAPPHAEAKNQVASTSYLWPFLQIALWDSSFSCYNPLPLLRVSVKAVSDLTNAALISRSPSRTTCATSTASQTHTYPHTHTHCGIMQTEASKYAFTLLSIYLKDLMGLSFTQ